MIKVRSQQVLCLHCGDPLIFKKGKGWVHATTGEVYAQKKRYPRLCKRDGHFLNDGFCLHCCRQYEPVLVDDHVATPDRTNKVR